MSPLSDLLVASKDELDRILEMPSPLSEFPGVDVKGISIVEISKLMAILEEREWTVEDIDRFPPIREAGPDGPWLFRLPSQLVDQMAELSEEKARELADVRAETEELQMSGWDHNTARSCLEEMIGLAAKANVEGKLLTMWNSL